MTYRVVQDEPCELDPPPCQQVYRSASGLEFPFHPCSDGCNGDGTRTVEVAMVEQDQRVVVDEWGNTKGEPVWVEVES